MLAKDGRFESAMDSPDGLIKDELKIALGKGRAFHVFLCLDLLACGECLLVRNWCHLLLSKISDLFGVISQIQFSSDQDDGDTGCVVLDLREPLHSRVSRFLCSTKPGSGLPLP